MDGSSAVGPSGGLRQALAGRSTLMLAIASAVVLGVAAIVVLMASSQANTTPRPQPARNFALAELGRPGRTISLAALAGKPVIINFFASWCGPCKRETPLLAAFYRDHHGAVAVIGVDANDANGPALKFIRAQGVQYPVAVDPFPAKVTVTYGVLALPQSFFLNARHMIVKHVVGGLTARELNSWAASLAGHGPG